MTAGPAGQPGTPPGAAAAGARPSRTAGFGKGGWIVAARIISQAAQFLTMLVAARVMGPAEFGVFTLLLTLAIALTRFSEAGWREYIMSTASPAEAAQANVLALICGAASMALGLAVGAGLLGFTGRGTSASVLMLMSGWVLLTTLSASQSGMLVRRDALRALALCQIGGEIAGLAAALVTFGLGGGIFGLVAAKIVMQAITLAACIAVTRWFPVVPLDRGIAPEALRFSRRILATRLIGFAQDNLSILVIGALVGPAAAGLFRAAGRLASALFELVSEPVRLLAWSSLQSDDPGRAADRLHRLTLLVATPLFVGLAVTAHGAVGLLLGDDWSAAAPLLAAFAVSGWLNTLTIVTEPLLVRRGRTELVPRLTLAMTAVHLVFLVSTAPLGIYWIAVGQAAATAVILPGVLFVQHRIGGISLASLLAGAVAPLLGAACLMAGVFAVRSVLPDGLPRFASLGAEVAAGAACYGVVALGAWRAGRLPAGRTIAG